MEPPVPHVAVFDFGGVVVQWSMRALLVEFFDDDAGLDHFLTHVLTPADNVRCDLGAPIAGVVGEIVERHPEHRVPLEAWRDRWIETIPGEIPGTAELIADLRAAGHPVLGLSNFSAETFPSCRAKYPIFEEFDDIVLSGEHGIGKPQPEIYHLLCERNRIGPSDAVFFDDSPGNVAGAHAIGMGAHLFTTAEQARLDLRSDGFRV